VIAIRDCGKQRFREDDSTSHVCRFDQLREAELRSADDGYEERALAFRGTHFGQFDMTVSDREALAFVLLGLALRLRADG
jgi:hypothetical protein